MKSHASCPTITIGLDVELGKDWGGRTHRGSVASG